jgi:drug/metabolite transporter (DMT)-like permease
METPARPASWKILLAFAIIYFVWGSTYLSIRVGVREVPPFLLAGLRFVLAGLFLYGWMRLKGVAHPSRREWAGICLQGTLIFLIDYGCVFWAEQRVPSGLAAVVLATIAIFITLLEVTILRTQRLTVRLSLALLAGLCGLRCL